VREEKQKGVPSEHLRGLCAKIGCALDPHLIGARLCLIGRDEVVRRRTTPGFRLARQTENGIDRSHACALDVVGVNRSWGSAGLLAELLFQVSQPDSCALRTYS
jgi:hypothetical protein